MLILLGCGILGLVCVAFIRTNDNGHFKLKDDIVKKDDHEKA